MVAGQVPGHYIERRKMKDVALPRGIAGVDAACTDIARAFSKKRFQKNLFLAT
jgi:hypothetical protein